LVDPSYAELVLAADLTVGAASDSYLRIVGKRREEVIGRPLREIIADGPDLEQLVDSLGLVLRTPRPHRTALDAIHGRGGPPARNGSSLAVNMPVLADDGSVKRLLHSLDPRSDERLPAAKALEAAEARLRSIMQTVPDAMIIIDERGLIESLSATA